MKAAQARFYFDEDIQRLAHTIARLRPDCTYPGDPGAVIHKRARPACPLARGAKDTEWVPLVATRGWLVISREFNIRENPSERRAVRQAGARMVALSGKDATSTWGQLEVLMKHWRRIDTLTDMPGPFIYLASRSGFRLLDLSG